MADKTKKSGKKDKSGKKLSKAEKKAARIAAKKEAKATKKGDGSFPDILVVTKNPDGASPFAGHDGENMVGLTNDGQTVAVYKLRKVSKISIKRKIER